jgi:hypothetical protein
MSSPQFYPGLNQTTQVFLVHRLPRHAQGFSDLRPGPSILHRVLDLGVFHAIRKFTERNDCRETVSDLAGRRRGGVRGRILGHISNLGCSVYFVN